MFPFHDRVINWSLVGEKTLTPLHRPNLGDEEASPLLGNEVVLLQRICLHFRRRRNRKVKALFISLTLAVKLTEHHESFALIIVAP